MITDKDRQILEQIEGGLIHPMEAERLAGLAAQVPAELAIVELGSYLGMSSCWMAAGSKSGNGARITCIDGWEYTARQTVIEMGHFDGDGSMIYPEFCANVVRGGWWDMITPLCSLTVDAAEFWRKDIGLLFIDAAHEYVHVSADIRAWLSFVVPGGLASFHDALGGAWPGVAQAISELIPKDWEELEGVGSLQTFRRPG